MNFLLNSHPGIFSRDLWFPQTWPLMCDQSSSNDDSAGLDFNCWNVNSSHPDSSTGRETVVWSSCPSDTNRPWLKFPLQSRQRSQGGAASHVPSSASPSRSGQTAGSPVWPGRDGVKSHPLTPFQPLSLPLSHTWKRVRCSCSDTHAILLISWVCNCIRMSVALSESLLVFVWPVRVCARWLPVIAAPGSLLSPPSGLLLLLLLLLVQLLLVSQRGKMREEKKHRQVKSRSSDIQKPHKQAWRTLEAVRGQTSCPVH